jgi:hypothetical protein
MWYVRQDIWASVESNYVRVDLYSYNYGWHQGLNSDGTHPLHATGTTAYNDTAGTVTSYDPFAYSPNASSPGSACTSAWYSNTADWGCVWTLSQNNYWLAMDKSGQASQAPVWW